MTPMNMIATSAAMALGVLSAAPAGADVIYQFTALSTVPEGPQNEVFSGSFTYDAPTFVVADQNVMEEQLLTPDMLSACSAESSLGTASCGYPDLMYNFEQESDPFVAVYDTIVFSVIGVTISNNYYFYFVPTAFGTPGIYKTIIVGGNEGALAVTDTELPPPPPPPVPEPAAWAMMILGMGAIGVSFRRRMSAAREREGARGGPVRLRGESNP